MNAMNEMPAPLNFTDAAAEKVRSLIEEEGNPELKLRVFVTGGGCSGFQYGFTFDEAVAEAATDKRFKGKPKHLARHCFALAVGYNVDEAMIERYDAKNPELGFDEAVNTARALSRRGDHDASSRTWCAALMPAIKPCAAASS